MIFSDNLLEMCDTETEAVSTEIVNGETVSRLIRCKDIWSANWKARCKICKIER